MKRDSKHPDHSAPSPKEAEVDRTETGRLIGLSLAAVVIAVVIEFPVLTPLITTAPIAWIVIRKLRAGRLVTAGLVLRWALTVFLTALVSMAFVWDQTIASFPYAASAVSAMRQALAGAAGPPVGYVFLTLGMVLFVGLCVLSAGILGFVAGSVALGASAAAAAVLYRSGDNIFQLLLVTVPWWQLAFYAAAILAVPPLVLISRATVLRWLPASGKTVFEWRRTTKGFAIAGALWLGAILLRLALASSYLHLVNRWTLP